MVAGSQVAHVLAYRLVYPQAQVRLRDLLATGHGYMLGHAAWVPLAAGVLGGAELLALGWAAVGAVRRGPARPLPAWAFALLPLVGYTLQEFLERWLVGSTFPWWFVLQPTFRVGLLLQLPFGLAVFLVARLLLRAVERAAEAFAGSAPLPVAVSALPAWGVVESSAIRSALLAVGRLGRGPPAVPIGTALV
jgi:hypothetical protein